MAIKTFLTLYLGLFLAVSTLALREPARLLAGLGVVVVSGVIDLIWIYFKTRIWSWPSSAVISGLITALIFDLASHPFLALIAPLVAAVGKRVLHFGQSRHLLNPAAFSLVVLSFFAPVASWWGLGWGLTPILITAAAGGYLLYRLRRWAMVLIFLATYLVFLAGQAVWGQTLIRFDALFWALIFDATLIFFATVMLIEPVTTSFPQARHRLIFGFLVGFLAAIFSFLPRFRPFHNMDPLLFSLVIGNLAIGLRKSSRV